MAECCCPNQVVSLNDCKAVFRGLDGEKEHFPIVARTEERAFYGLLPNVLGPTRRQEIYSSVADTGCAYHAPAPLAPSLVDPNVVGDENPPGIELLSLLDSPEDERTELDSSFNSSSTQRSDSSRLGVHFGEEHLNSVGSTTQHDRQAAAPSTGAVNSGGMAEQMIGLQVRITLPLSCTTRSMLTCLSRLISVKCPNGFNVQMNGSIS